MTRQSTSKGLIQSTPEPLPWLPKTIKMSDGQEHDVSGDVWILTEGSGRAITARFNWTILSGIVIKGESTPVMSTRAISLVKLYLLERMTDPRRPLKSITGEGILRSMQHFAYFLAAYPEWWPVGRSFDWSDLTEEMFDLWLTLEYRTKRKGDSAADIRCFYLWGADPDANRPDFSIAFALVLERWRIKYAAKGELVKSRNKRRGPLTREELELIFDACMRGAGTDQDRAITLTLLETAIRPKQMYNFTNRDLEIVESKAAEEGVKSTLVEVSYRLKVRKLKQRGNTTKYHYLPLSVKCVQLLLSLRKPGSGLDEPLFWWIIPRYGQFIRHRLRAFSEAADLRSPRLPIKSPEVEGPFYERLHVTPRRLRYGLATDRIARRESPDNVAEMLGHQDTRTVDLYVETSPGIADDFQRATDSVIGPLIDLLVGRANPSKGYLQGRAVTPVSSRLEPYGDTQTSTNGTANFLSRLEHRKSHYAGVFPDISIEGDKSEARVKDLIARARRKFRINYPGQDFDQQIWDTTHLQERPNVSTVANFGFTTLTSNQVKFSSRPEDALPASFADVVKSWLVISSDVMLATNAMRLHAASHFWNFLSTRQGRQVVPFVWEAISEGDLLAFEQFLLTYETKRGKPLSDSSILTLIHRIQCLVDFLATHGICPRIYYVPQLPPVRGATNRSLDAKKRMAERKLPQPGVHESLAGIYHRLTTAKEGEASDWILIIISALVILMLTGFRIGELATLPFDCEVEDKLPRRRPSEPESYRYGIRYWLEKAHDKTMRVRWISPTAEPIVRASITRIKRLTAAPRERARVLEANPTTVPLPPDISSQTIILRPELVALLGYRRDRAILTDPQGLLPQHGIGPESYFYIKDLEAYLLWRREPLLFTVRHDDSSVQMLSESLFVVFNKQSYNGRAEPCRLLVEPVKAGTFRNYLCSRFSFFKIYGEAEWEKELSANSHSFRHWLIHTAYKGGMKMQDLLRYFDKQESTDIADYLHFSTNESGPYVPEELRADRFYIPT